MTGPYTKEHNLKFLPVADVYSFSDPGTVVLLDARHGGYSAREVPGSVNVQIQTTEQPRACTVKITWRCSDISSGMQRLLDAIRGSHFLLIYHDADEQPMVAGTLDHPLQLDYVRRSAQFELSATGTCLHSPMPLRSV